MPINIDSFRQRLQAALAEIEAAIAQSDHAAATVTVKLDQSSVGRLSRMDALQQQAMAVGVRERLAVKKLKLTAALNRITEGRFGLCCQCEADIARDRLDSEPAAVFCADCSMEREIHGDRVRDDR